MLRRLEFCLQLLNTLGLNPKPTRQKKADERQNPDGEEQK
jgi:hypothetical protein